MKTGTLSHVWGEGRGSARGPLLPSTRLPVPPVARYPGICRDRSLSPSALRITQTAAVFVRNTAHPDTTVLYVSEELFMAQENTEFKIMSIICSQLPMNFIHIDILYVYYVFMQNVYENIM